mgnify:FL=1
MRRLFDATRLLLALLVLSAALAGPAAAQAWPSKPVKLVNGYPAGGGADILARLVAEKLTAALGQQVIVDNRTGATGMIAAQSVAAAAPDGYTVLFYTMNMCCTSPVMPGNKVNIDPDKDLMPVVRVAGLDNLLYVSPQTPFRTVKDVIDAAKAAPGKLTYGSSGVGGSYHLWAALFTTLAGIEMLHVPFRGGPPAIAEIVAGRIDMMFGNLAEILPHIRNGGVRAIAFTSVPPSPVLPGVPTIGQTLPDYRSDNWFGLGLPAGTPPAIADRLNAEVRRLVADKEFSDRLVSMGYQPIGDTIPEMKAAIQSDRAKWKKVIDATGIRAE